MAIDERLVFLEGKYVRLKALSPQDVVESGWVGWFNDSEMSVNNEQHYFPNTFENQQEFLKTCISPTKLQLGIVDRKDNSQICGVVCLKGIDLIHRHAEIAGIQSHKLTKSKPEIFMEAWTMMLKHGFNQLGLQKIFGGAFHPYVTDALVRMFNFEKEGVRRKHLFKNNTFVDLDLIAVFKDTVRYPEF